MDDKLDPGLARQDETYRLDEQSFFAESDMAVIAPPARASAAPSAAPDTQTAIDLLTDEQEPSTAQQVPDLMNDPVDESDYPAETMTPKQMDPNLIKVIQGNDIRAYDYPGLYDNIQEAFSKGYSREQVYTLLARDEAVLALSMKPAELDRFYGRTDDTRLWQQRRINETSAKLLAQTMGITEDEAAKRLKISKETGISLSALSYPEVYRKVLEQRKVEDDVYQGAVNGKEKAEIQDQTGRSAFADATWMATEWFKKGNQVSDEDKKRVLENRKKRIPLNERAAELEKIIYTSTAADYAAATSYLAWQNVLGAKESVKYLTGMVGGMLGASAVAEAGGGFALGSAGALGTVVNFAAAHPVLAGVGLVGMTYAAGNAEHAILVEGGHLFDELLDNGADPVLAGKLAVVGGVVNGLIEVGNMGVMLSMIPGFDKAKEALTAAAASAGGIESAAGKKTVAAILKGAFREWAIKYVKGALSEQNEEFWQKAVDEILLGYSRWSEGRSTQTFTEFAKSVFTGGTEEFLKAGPEIWKGMLATSFFAPGYNAAVQISQRSQEQNAAPGDSIYSEAEQARLTALRDYLLIPKGEENTAAAPIDFVAPADAGKQITKQVPDFAAADTTDTVDAAPAAEAAPAQGEAPATEPETTPESAPVTEPAETEAPQQTPESGTEKQETGKPRSDLRPASPEKVSAAVSPSTVYVSCEAMDAYLQTLPENERKTLRDSLGMTRVDKTNEYLIDTKKFVAAGEKFVGLERAVLDDVRRGPLGMTRRELTSIKDKVRYKESDPMEGSSQIAVEAREVRDDMTKKLRAIGYSQEQAEVMADAQAHAIFGFSRLYGIDPVTGNWTGEVLSPKAWYEQLEIRRAQQQTPQESAAEAAGTIAQTNNGVFNQELFQPEDYDENGRIRPEVIREITDELNAIRTEAQANGTYLKAPNGTRSKLPSGVWEMTRTRRFKEWFGDSWVMDNGEPLIVYHGTNNAGFSSFVPNNGTTTWDAGLFFTASDSVASTYANGSEDVISASFNKNGELILDKEGNLPLGNKSGVYACFLKIEHPYFIDAEGRSGVDAAPYWSVRDAESGEIIEDGFASEKQAQDYVNDEYGEDADNYEVGVFGYDDEEENYYMSTNKVARAVYAGEMGMDTDASGNPVPYDGVIFQNINDNEDADKSDTLSDVYSVPNPSQIKSIDNRGTFDAGENIFYQEVEYERRLNEDIQNWVATIDTFLDNPKGINKGKNLTVLRQTPLVLALVGAKIRPLETKATTLNKMMRNPEKHMLSPELVKQIPGALAEPVMIFKDEQEDNALIVLLALKEDGRSLIAPISLEIPRGSEPIMINLMRSAYDLDARDFRKNGKGTPNEGWVLEQISENRLLYVDEEKTLTWATEFKEYLKNHPEAASARLTWSKLDTMLSTLEATIQNGSLDKSIKTKVDLVNARGASGNTLYQPAAPSNTVELNAATVRDAESRAYMREQMLERGMSEADADGLMALLDGIADKVLKLGKTNPSLAQWNEQQPLRVMDKVHGLVPVRSAFKKNGEYPVNFDLGALCTKREGMDLLIQILADKGLTQQLGPTQIEALKTMLKDEGFLTACDICFVETKRMRMLADSNKTAYAWKSVLMAAGIEDGHPIGTPRELTAEQRSRLERMADTGKNGGYLAAYDELMPEERRRTKDKSGADLDTGITADMMGKIAKLFLEDPSLAGELDPAMLMTTRGTDWLVRTYGGHTNILGTLAGMYGAATSKPLEGFNIFDNLSFRKDFDSTAVAKNNKALYDIGGSRSQSFTDFNPLLFLDYVQMIAELQIRQMPMQVYTKVPAHPKLFGATGMMINMSLVPEIAEGVDAEHAGLRPDGRGGWEYAWHEDSFPVKEAYKLRKRKEFGGRVGIIAVGVSDAHIQKMLADPEIDMIIPYHSSGMPFAVKVKTGLIQATDYTKVQETKIAKGAKSTEFNYNEALQRLKDPRAAANEYLQWCRDNGHTPKFPQFAGHENYYKLLEDFRGYDNDGKPVLQGPVNLKLTRNWAKVLSEALAERTTAQAKMADMANNQRLMDKAKQILAPQRLDGELRERVLGRLETVLGKGNVTTLRQVDFFKALEAAYTETMGAEKASATVEVFRRGDGVVYGFTSNGKIVLNELTFNANTPAHEFAHVWAKVAQAKNAPLWNEGVALLKQHKLWNEVASDPLYANIAGDENAIASEVLARLVGSENEDFVRSLIDPTQKLRKGNALLQQIRDWVVRLFNEVRSLFAKNGETLSYEEFIRMPMKALWDEAEGKSFKQALTQMQRDAELSALEMNAKALDASIGNTEHGYGVAVNEKGQLVGANNRYDQSAWHGTPHRFDRFDLGAIGTGEGAQVHGWGLYFAKDKKVSEDYRNELSAVSYDFTYAGEALDPYTQQLLADRITQGDLLNAYDDPDTFKDILDNSIDLEKSRLKDFRQDFDDAQKYLDYIEEHPGMSVEEFCEYLGDHPPRFRPVFSSLINKAKRRAGAYGRDATIADVESVIEDYRNEKRSDIIYSEGRIDRLEQVEPAKLSVVVNREGSLFEVDIPENDVLLNEDLVFKRQPEKVQQGLKKVLGSMTRDQLLIVAKVTSSMQFDHPELAELRARVRAYENAGFAGEHMKNWREDDNLTHPAVRNAFTTLHQLGLSTDDLQKAVDDQKFAAELVARIESEAQQKLAEAKAALEKAEQEANAQDDVRLEEFVKNFGSDAEHGGTATGGDIYEALSYAVVDRATHLWGAADPRSASLALNDAGIKGITYDGRQDGRCFVVFDDKAISVIERYNQEVNGQQPRGSITFNGRLNEGGTAVIDLFKAADASTFLHESAHFLLQSYLDFGRMANAPAQLKQDLGVILNFLGVKDAGEVGREQHEKWARTVELYFMEGKAPSSALAKVFARMKRWLLGIYHHARHLNTEITPEVREVLDRLYAGMNEEDAEVATLSDLRQDDEAAAEAVARMEAEEAQEQQDAASPKTQNRRQASRIREALKRAAERRRKAQAELKAKQQERKLLKKEIAGILKKIKAASEDKGILWAFQEKIRGVLAGYTLKNPSRQKLMQAMELYNYLIDHPGEMSIEDYAPADRAYIEMLGTTMLPDMTLGELRALGRHIEELREEGKKAYEQWKAARQQRRDQMWNECYAALGEIPSTEGMVIRGPQDLRKQYKGVKGKLEKAGDWNYAVTLGSHRLMDWIGNGHGKFNSAWTKYFIEAVNTAHDEYLRLRGDRYEALDKVLKANGLKKYDFGRVRVVDGIEYTVDEMLSVYALLKNEKGTKALLYGNFKGLGDSALAHAAHIVQSLTREEINVADAVLDDYEKHFDRLNRRFIEVYNEAMVKEENYSPMKRLEYTSAQGLIDAESAETIEGRSIAAGRLAGLDKGFTIRRLEISEEHQQPVDLGLLSMWADQVTVQEHMYAFAQLTGDLSSVLLKRNEVNGMTMAKAIRLTKGPEAWNSVVGYTNIVTQNEARLAHSVMNGVTKHFIRGMSVTYLGLTQGSRLKQVTSTPRFLMTVGLKAGLGRLVAQVGKWSINPARYMREAYRLDPQLKERIPIPAYAGYRIDPTTMSEAKYRYEEGLKATTYMLGVFDRAVAAIGWRATYENEIANGSSPEQAHHAAQRAVALTQQVPNLKDMPAFWRQNGLTKLMMVFSSNAIPIWGMTVYDLAQAIKRGDWPKSFVTTTALAVSAMATMFVSHGLPDGDDDDSLLDWMVDAFTEQTITSLPIVGKDLFAAYDELINKNRRGNSYSAFVAPIAGLIQGFQRVSSEKADEVLQSGLTRRQAGGWQIAEAIALLMGGFPVTEMRRIHTLIKSGDWKQALPILLAWQRQKKKSTKKAVSW